MTKNVMFSGGIPAEGAEGVYRLLAATAGPRAQSWPDGETTLSRRGWIGAINQQVFAKAPFFEEVPADDEALADSRYTAGGILPLRIVAGAEVDLRGHLPYASDAVASYEVFTKLKTEGVIPAETRFQVSVPGAHDVVSISFADPDDWPVVFAAWTSALQDEYRRILEVIPAGELTVQLDYCTELIHIGGVWQDMIHWVPNTPREELFAQLTSVEYLEPHVAGLPEDVVLGLHICCGTSPHFPVLPLDDIALPVALANAVQASLGGRIGFAHLPALPDSDAAYFAPLADLELGEAQVFLGLECNDGLEAMKARINAARSAREDFGVAHYCGYLWNQEIMPELLKTLDEGAAFAERG